MAQLPSLSPPLAIGVLLTTVVTLATFFMVTLPGLVRVVGLGVDQLQHVEVGSKPLCP